MNPEPCDLQSLRAQPASFRASHVLPHMMGPPRIPRPTALVLETWLRKRIGLSLRRTPEAGSVRLRKSQALGEEQIRIPIAEARSRMNALGGTLGVKIFEKLASASDRQHLREFLLSLLGARSALLGFVERRELCCTLLEHRLVGDLVALINRFRAVADHRHSGRARDARPFEIANCGPAEIVGLSHQQLVHTRREWKFALFPASRFFPL
jgi:hypothetical protein